MGAKSDPLAAAANVYRLLMENDRVRVMEALFKPGDKAEMHHHPDHVVYVNNDSKLKIRLEDGNSMEAEVKAGQVLWMPSGSHEVENMGKTVSRNLVVELK